MSGATKTRRDGRLTGFGIGVLLIGVFLPVTDFFIVNVALPTIQSTLRSSPPMLELVVAGYGTAYALLLVVGGRLGDTYGRRRILTIGLIGFTITSLACGLAPTIEVLVIARIVQGAAAAMLVPQVLATFQATLEGASLHRALGLFGATGGIASVVGQLLGGLLVAANIGGTQWRPIFLINVPIGIVLLLILRKAVPETRSPHPAALDRVGTLLFGVAMICLLVPLTEGASLGWPLWTWLVLALVPIALAATVVVERRVERSGRTPLLPPALLGRRSMKLGLPLGLPFFMGFGAFMLVFALTVQDGLHHDALSSGLAFLPLSVAYFIGSLLTPRLIRRLGKGTITIGSILQAIGLIGLTITLLAQWPEVSLLALAPSMAVTGFGQSLVFGSIFRVILADVPPHQAGIGSGVAVTLQQSGLALGIATLGSLFLGLQAAGIDRAFAITVGVQTLLMIVLAVGSIWLPSLRSAKPADVRDATPVEERSLEA
jgi:MFS family permease